MGYGQTLTALKGSMCRISSLIAPDIMQFGNPVRFSTVILSTSQNLPPMCQSLCLNCTPLARFALIRINLQRNLSWETIAMMRDHLSWRTTSFWQKALHFSVNEPVTKDHRSSETIFYDHILWSFKKGSTVSVDWLQIPPSYFTQISASVRDSVHKIDLCRWDY